MIQFFNISKSYGRNSTALSEISVAIPKGDFVYITGPSGAGKSTLLKLLYCAEKPSRGQILFSKRNITRLRPKGISLLRRQIGVIFQDFKLLTNRTVFENVAFALEVQGHKRYMISKQVYEILKYVGLEDKLQNLPLELSGGEQQRVAIARALVVKPSVLIADEPTGNLDIEVTMDIMHLFQQAKERGTTVLIATHNREIMRRFPGREISLNKGCLVNDIPVYQTLDEV